MNRPLTDHARAHAALSSALRFSEAAGAMRKRGEDGQTALDRMRSAQGSLRSARYDGSPVSGNGVADPTSSSGPDIAVRDMRLLDRALRQAVRSAHEAQAILARYGEPHPPTAADLLALAKLNGTPEPGCGNCARIEGPRGGVRWEPIDPAMTKPTTGSGLLSEPTWLCSWCRRRLLEWGRLPSPDELERHHRGERVSWPKDVPRPDRTKGVSS